MEIASWTISSNLLYWIDIFFFLLGSDSVEYLFQLPISTAMFPITTLFALAATASAAIFNDTDITYAPYEGYCPSYNSSAIYNTTTHEGYIRSNYLISQDEYSYISARKVKTTDKLISFLDNLEIPDYNGTSFANYFNDLNQTGINIGLSFSGGGFRALFNGAGEIMALDSRTTGNSTLKGLLDASTYISGISGGSIMVNTLVFNNWTSVEDIVYSNETSIWNTTAPPVSTEISFWLNLISQVEPKKEAGYEITLADLYGRILSKYMFEKDYDDYGINTLYSDVPYIEAFQDFDMPFPIIAASGNVNNNMSAYTPNLFEITPYEFGSFSPLVGGFIPIDILGTQFDAGMPNSSYDCTYEFDNVGWLTAASSNILVAFQESLVAALSGNSTASTIDVVGTNVSVSYVEALVGLVNKNVNDTLFAVVDNPFFNSSLSSNDSDIPYGDLLKLIDGGYSEVIPLDPVLVPSREVDVVFAFDNSGSDETDNYPDGDSLFATEERWAEAFPDDVFYALPNSTEEFVELGLNKRPVFFGCNGSSLVTDQYNPNATVEFNVMKPLLVYIPNYNASANSNITGFQLTYEERNAIVENGFDIVQNDDDEDFAQCVGCAIIRRSEERAGIEISPFCAKCFNRYCFESLSDEQYDNSTISEVIPTSIYSSSALPSKLSSLLTRSTSSVSFPTTFSKPTHTSTTSV